MSQRGWLAARLQLGGASPRPAWTATAATAAPAPSPAPRTQSGGLPDRNSADRATMATSPGRMNASPPTTAPAGPRTRQAVKIASSVEAGPRSRLQAAIAASTSPAESHARPATTSSRRRAMGGGGPPKPRQPMRAPSPRTAPRGSTTSSRGSAMCAGGPPNPRQPMRPHSRRTARSGTSHTRAGYKSGVSSRMRLAFAGIAVAILVLAIALLSGGGDDNNDEKPAAQVTATAPAATATATAGETPTPEATETPAPTVDPGPLLTGAKVVKIEVDKGGTVRFRVRSPQDDEVHVHGYDLKKDLPANQTISMSFKATIDGIFEIEFEEQGKQIASLRVNP